MPAKRYPPAPYRQNANGTITVQGFRRKVVISAATAEAAKIWATAKSGSDHWSGPVPGECPECRQPSCFKTKSVRRGEELLIITYRCANCGHTDIDYLD